MNYECGTVKNVHYGDVLIKFGDYIDAAETAEDDTVGKCTEIQGAEGLKLLSGLHTIACRPKEKYGSMFLGYYINSPAYHSQLKPLMQGIKVTSISKSALQDTDMIMPKSIEEQTRIGAYFVNLDNLITLHQRSISDLVIIHFHGCFLHRVIVFAFEGFFLNDILNKVKIERGDLSSTGWVKFLKVMII